MGAERWFVYLHLRYEFRFKAQPPIWNVQMLENFLVWQVDAFSLFKKIVIFIKEFILSLIVGTGKSLGIHIE